MNDRAAQPQEYRQANLNALHRQLQELAAKSKTADRSAKQPVRLGQGPLMIIRGK